MLEPRENRKLIAHKSILKKLFSDFKENKLPNSIIFSGNKGIGKTTLVYHFINKILSENEKKEEAISLFGDSFGNSESSDVQTINEESETYKKIKNNSHPDLLVIEKEYNIKTKKINKDIKVDQIRKINEFLSLTSGFSKYRFILIDTADDMNINSANAILKILEEPPKNSFIFLISNNPSRLLDTIRSRCRILKVPNLSFNEWKNILQINSEINTGLKKILKNNEDLKALYNLSEGSVSVAIEFLEFSTLELYEEVINLILRPNSEKRSKILKKISHKDFPWSIFCYLINSLFCRLIKFKALEDQELILINQENELFQNYITNNSMSHLLEKNSYIDKMMMGVEKSNLNSEYMFNLVMNELIELKNL